MKQIPAIWFAFFGFVTFGQAEASDKDYLFQTINIFETKVLNELAKYSSNSDSIQLLAGFTVYGGLDMESAVLFGSLYGKVRKEGSPDQVCQKQLGFSSFPSGIDSEHDG